MNKKPYTTEIVPNRLDPGIESINALNMDGVYIGSVETAEYLCITRGISPELASPKHKICSIGFCEKEQKWYGWSHRAINGFGVGAQVVKGDCAYVANTPEGLITSRVEFFSDISKECADRRRAECQILEDRSGIRILHEPLVLPMAGSVADVVKTLNGEPIDTMECDISPGFSTQKCGRGEWTAKTLEDAKQMAIDYAESVR